MTSKGRAHFLPQPIYRPPHPPPNPIPAPGTNGVTVLISCGRALSSNFSANAMAGSMSGSPLSSTNRQTAEAERHSEGRGAGIDRADVGGSVPWWCGWTPELTETFLSKDSYLMVDRETCKGTVVCKSKMKIHSIQLTTSSPEKQRRDRGVG